MREPGHHKVRSDQKIVVVGGGAIGLCAAIALSERGAAVTLVERGLPGAANSTLTGGGIRQQFGTSENIRMSLLADPFWQEFKERFGVDPLIREIGYLFLARSGDEASAVAKDVTTQNQMGVDSEYLDEGELTYRWPALGRCGFVAAGFRQRDGWANQQRIIDGLYRGALAQQVDLQVGTECISLVTKGDRVVGVKTTQGTIDADAVLMATGPWGLPLLDGVGVTLPLSARRHELLVVRPEAPLPATLPWLIGIRDQIHLRSDVPGRALVGGFLGHDDAVHPDRYETRANDRWTADVLAKVDKVFGLVNSRAKIDQSWAGLYPSTPDHYPIIDRVADGLYVAMGFSGTGLMHAPAAAILATELILDGAMASHEPEWLSASRFGENPASAERTGF